MNKTPFPKSFGSPVATVSSYMEVRCRSIQRVKSKIPWDELGGNRDQLDVLSATAQADRCLTCIYRRLLSNRSLLTDGSALPADGVKAWLRTHPV